MDNTAKNVLPIECLNQAWKKPSLEELRNLLTPLQFKVTQENGTERAFSDPRYDTTEAGLYVDVVSGEPLFASIHKYDSGTGWPSFTKPITPEVITLHEDRHLFMKRTEVRSKLANSHLGHVFSDGPVAAGGMRYCLNGAALHFVPRSELAKRGYAAFEYLFTN